MLTLHRVEHFALYLIGGVAAVFLPLVLSCPVFVCLFVFFDNRPLPRTRGSVILCRNYGARAWLSAKLPKLRREDEANCEVTLIGPKIEVPW